MNRMLLGGLLLAAAMTNPTTAVMATSAGALKMVMGIVGLLIISTPLIDGTFREKDDD